MFKLTHYLGRYKSHLFFAPLFKFLEAATDLVTPILVALILDRGIPNGDTNFIIWVSVGVLAMNLFGFVCAIICQKLSAKACRGVGMDIRRDMYAHITSLSRAEKDRFTTMALTNRVVHDVSQIENAIGMTVRNIARAPFLLVGATIAAMIIDLKLSLVFLAVMPFIVLVVMLIMKKSSPKYVEAKTSLDRVSNVTRENLSGNRVVRAFNKQEDEIKKFDAVNEEFTKKNIDIGKLAAFMRPLLYIIIQLGTIAVVYFGGVHVNAGRLTQGKIISFINYFMQISSSLVVIARLIIVFTRTGASIKRVGEVFSYSTSVKVATNPIRIDENVKPAIEFRDVCFSYNNLKNVVDHLTISIAAGSTIGIIGGTGSGKSTLVNLLPRLYDVTSGEILLDGVNIKKYDLDDLRNYVAIVPQNPILFKGTIESNLRFRKKDATNEEITKALRISQSYEFVYEKPDNLKTRVERGGTNFSGGQRQRLTIARALVGDPSILILDDSSSALDFETDYKLRQALSVTLKETTKIIVSQRTNSIKGADQIIVMDNGSIVGIGKHKGLLRTCAVYKEIYDSQNKKKGE
ncbi:MAG: ABC transporter ATP-binding protein [Clostridia bacterium]|nr:ABC transporter ATP-binding protein [Clostridia bacterium]